MPEQQEKLVVAWGSVSLMEVLLLECKSSKKVV